MLQRPVLHASIEKALQRSPVVALLGPRQCGKTTMARAIAASRPAAFFDMESHADRSRLSNPQLALEGLGGLIVIDEIQHQPDLLQTLRVLADRPDQPARFLILGSASPDIVRHSSETLAGRIEFIDMGGFDMFETGPEALDALWSRGTFPRSFLAATEEDSFAWRQNFIRTFLERDIPQLGITIPAETLRRFWIMLAHYHGQTWNASEISRSFGVSDKTVRHYLDLLSGTFMVRQLPPWFENTKKRQIKSPKVYLRDSGLAHALLGLRNHDELMAHPKSGASWEGFALEQVIRAAPDAEIFFWATHAGAELDLLLLRGGKKFGVECKLGDAPRLTRSMRTALENLHLQHLWVIYPGRHRYPLDPKVTALPLRELRTELLFSPPSQ
ncbi:MAG: ATP-binding protein [Thermodesulfobacteriota bacterium]